MVMTNIRGLILLGDILVLNINFLIGNLVTWPGFQSTNTLCFVQVCIILPYRTLKEMQTIELKMPVHSTNRLQHR